MPRLTSRVRDVLLPVVSRQSRRPGWRPDDVILILQPDHLGDVLLSQPAVRFIRDASPSSRLVAIVGPWSREIAEIAWPVDEVRSVEFPGFTRRRRDSPVAPYRLLYRAADDLACLRARAAVVLRPDAWWAAWLASMSAVAVVTGDEPRTAGFATRSIAVDPDAHAVLRSLSIARGIAPGRGPAAVTPAQSPLSLPTSNVGTRQAREMLFGQGVVGRYVVIHPGSGALVKEWPAQRWNVVASALARAGYRVIVTGTESERGLCEEVIADVSGAASLAGRTPLPVLIELLSGASLVAGPDSGPLHLAVAAGAPTVHLYGPSDPGRYGPWGDPSSHVVVRADWRCARCGDLSLDREPGCGCMLAIDPARVVTAIRGLLATTAAA